MFLDTLLELFGPQILHFLQLFQYKTLFDRQIDFDIEKFLINVTLEISV